MYYNRREFIKQAAKCGHTIEYMYIGSKYSSGWIEMPKEYNDLDWQMYRFRLKDKHLELEMGV